MRIFFISFQRYSQTLVQTKYFFKRISLFNVAVFTNVYQNVAMTKKTVFAGKKFDDAPYSVFSTKSTK